VVFDAPALPGLRRQAPDRYGPLVGRIVTNEKYAAALEKGNPLRAAINGTPNASTRTARSLVFGNAGWAQTQPTCRF
jgi:hypothetical protein